MKDEMLEFRKNALLGKITGEPLCQEYNQAWRKCSNNKEQLVMLALKQQSLPLVMTYSYQGSGLSKEYMMQEFKDYINGRYTAIDVDGVKGDYKSELYVGEDASFVLSSDVSCFMYSDVPTLEIAKCKATKIYCGCGSTLRIVSGGYNSIIIMLFDDSKVILDDIDEESTVTIYKYSDKCEVEQGKFCFGKVKIFNKTLRL